MPITPSLDRRLAFLRFDPAERDLLAELRPTLEARADAFIELFYRHLLGFEETRCLLADPVVRDRLLASQRRYLLSLTDAKLGDDYARNRREIGLAHVRVGLAPTWYLGAYALYATELGAAIDEHFEGDPNAAALARSGLEKLLLLDMQIAMEAYIEKREQQLDFLNKELARAERGLAKEIDEQKVELRETTERARAAEQLASVGTLAAGLAHEIGTPMSVIRGHAELLESRVGDETGQWRLRTIIEQIDRISNIMQALLDFARPRKPQVTDVQLEQVVATSLSFLQEKLRRRGVEVERDFQPLPSIRGDAEKLQQLFLNLILNAADAMADGGELRIQLRTDGPDAVCACVRDTGPGIPPENLPRIFDPFFTSKEAGLGNGLGLVVAHGIVLDHGGRIEARSPAGSGAEFVIQLPVRGAEASGAEAAH